MFSAAETCSVYTHVCPRSQCRILGEIAQGRGFHVLGHHLAGGLLDSSSRSP